MKMPTAEVGVQRAPSSLLICAFKLVSSHENHHEGVEKPLAHGTDNANKLSSGAALRHSCKQCKLTKTLFTFRKR